MTTDEINTLIATSLGWTNVHVESGSTEEGTQYAILVGRKPGGTHDADVVPNYAGDAGEAIELVPKIEVHLNRPIALAYSGVQWHLAEYVPAHIPISSDLHPALCVAKAYLTSKGLIP